MTRQAPNCRLIIGDPGRRSEYGGGRHTSAQDVILLARERRPGIGFTTVHRGLARLHELGYVLKLDISGEGPAMYEPPTTPHAHFRFTACGAVDDVDYACDAATRDALEARHGLVIRNESITFTGLCGLVRAPGDNGAAN